MVAQVIAEFFITGACTARSTRCCTVCMKVSHLFLPLRYGGGPTIEREVIRLAGGREELRVEIYPLRLRVTCRTAAVAAVGAPTGLPAVAADNSSSSSAGGVKIVTLSKRVSE